MNEDTLYPIEVNEMDKNYWAYPIYEAAKEWYRRKDDATMTVFASSSFRRMNPWGVSETATPTVEPTSPELMANAVLNNSSPEEQTLKTGEFGKEISTSWSSSQSNTRNFGMELEANISFGPKCFKAGFRLQYNMNFSYTETKTQSGSQVLKYTLPCQEVKVPPHSIRYVYAVLEKGKAYGKVNLLMTAQPGYRSRGKDKWGNIIDKDGTAYDLLTEMAPYMKYDRISPDSKNKAVLFSDEFNYTIEAAFNVTILVRDKPMEQGGRTIDSWTVNPEEIMVEAR